MVTIRRCTIADVPDVLSWLDHHWKRGHVFTVAPSLFEWQHALPDRPGEYSVAIARRDADDALLGLLGYVMTRQFDPSLAADNTLWLALWKVRDDIDAGGLGLRLVRYVMDQELHSAAGVLGFKPGVRGIYQALGFSVGELEHYVLANPDISHFELASFKNRPPAAFAGDGLSATIADERTFLQLASGFEVHDRYAYAPRKTPAFFHARYLQHPFYRYTCLVVYRGARAIGVLATRMASHGGRSAVRIVDYLGPTDAVADLGPVVLEEIRRTGAEYADVYNSGIDAALFERAGFTRVDPDGPDIVPDHFEPFEQRNVRLSFALKAPRPAILFKGDSDQDRPSQLPPS
jgi:hypothetical protein